jgi:hypothetical protein
VTLDYNLYFSSTGAAAGIWLWNGTKYVGFTSYQQAIGQDAHSNFENPRLLKTTYRTWRCALRPQPPTSVTISDLRW